MGVFRSLAGTQLSGLRALALLIAVVGAWGTISEVASLAELLETRRVPNPSLVSERRLHGSPAIADLTSSFRGNFVTVVVATVLFVVFAFHLFGLVRSMSHRSPILAILAAVFFAGGTLSGVFIGLTALKVNELAFQHAMAPENARTWLENGMAFLNQLHLVSVYGWFLCSGIAWLMVGLAAPAMRGKARLAALIVLGGALALVVGVGARHWLPGSGAQVSARVAFLGSEFVEFGMALSFLGSGLLAWLLEGDRTRGDA